MVKKWNVFNIPGKLQGLLVEYIYDEWLPNKAEKYIGDRIPKENLFQLQEVIKLFQIEHKII